MKTKKCFICSPYQDDQGQNAARAARYCRNALWEGFIPVAPHLFIHTYLYDTHSDGLYVNRLVKNVLEECAEFRVYCDELTEEMLREIKKAQDLRIPVKFYDVDMREVDYETLIVNKRIGPAYRKVISEAHGDYSSGTVCPYAAECSKAGEAEASTSAEPAAAPEESCTEVEPTEEDKNSIGRRLLQWIGIFFTMV